MEVYVLIDTKEKAIRKSQSLKNPIISMRYNCSCQKVSSIDEMNLKSENTNNFDTKDII